MAEFDIFSKIVQFGPQDMGGGTCRAMSQVIPRTVRTLLEVGGFGGVWWVWACVFIVAVFRVCFRRGSQVTRKPAGGWGLGVLLEGYGAGFSGFRGVFVEGFWKVLGGFLSVGEPWQMRVFWHFAM